MILKHCFERKVIDCFNYLHGNVGEGGSFLSRQPCPIMAAMLKSVALGRPIPGNGQSSNVAGNIIEYVTTMITI